MNWKFWEKNDIILEKIDQLGEAIKDLKNDVNELQNKNKQINRVIYKNNREIKAKIDIMEQNLIKKQKLESKIERLTAQINGQESKINYFVEQIIEMIDEIDRILSGLNEEDNWIRVLHNWSNKLLYLLREQNIYQLNLKGKRFNPRLAEAISTVSRQELEQTEDDQYQNYDIIKVVKRGFITDDEVIIRKASVITLKEEGSYDRETV